MRVEQGTGTSQVGISFFVGLGLIVAGAYFGYLTFTEATEIIHDPNVLEKWLDLQKKIFAELSPEKNNTSKMIETRIVSGHILVGLALIYVFILARITIAFLKNGVNLALKSMQIHKDTKDS